jgi:hypothetical protein
MNLFNDHLVEKENQGQGNKFKQIYQHLISMKDKVDESIDIDILQDSFLSIFNAFAPKLFAYRFNSNIVASAAESYC